MHLCDVIHLYMRHGSFMCATWLMYICDVTHSNMRHDSFRYATWLIYHVQHRLSVRATWRIHGCDTSHSYMRHDSFTRVPWLIHTIHSHVWHDSFIMWHVQHRLSVRATWHIHGCDPSHVYMRHDSFTSVPWLIHTCAMTNSHDSLTHMTWFVHTCTMTHSHDSFTRVTVNSVVESGAAKPHVSFVCAHAAGPYASCQHIMSTHALCQQIQCPAPPMCPLTAGTWVVQKISTRPFWSGGNQKTNRVV